MKLLFTLLSFCLLFACTITKRQFGAGYHVEWKRNLHEKHETKENENPHGKFSLEVSEVRDLAEEIKMPESDTIIPKIPLEEIKEHSVSAADEQELKIPVGTRCIASQLKLKEEQVTNPSSRDLNQPIPEAKKKTEPLTWVSIILFLGIGISVGLITIFSSFLYLGTGIFLTGLVLVLFICSLISFIRVSRHPDRYKNKVLTRFMFALSMVCLTVVALYFLYVVGVLSFSEPMLQGI